MFVIGPNRKELENKGLVVSVYIGALLWKWWRQYVRFDIWPFMFQSWFAPVSFLQGKSESCLPLVKHYDQRCRLPYQKPSGYPAVLSSWELLATSRQYLSSRTTWARPTFTSFAFSEISWNKLLQNFAKTQKLRQFLPAKSFPLNYLAQFSFALNLFDADLSLRFL